MKTVEAAVIGVGWVGGTRAETLARTALVDKLHLCEIRPDRLAEVKKLYKPATATLDYNDIINNPNISVVYISTTPESNHYPICRDCLKSGKNVMLEKPIALVTNRCLFTFGNGRFTVASVHPGHTIEEVIEHTGFDFDRPESVPETQAPSPATLKLMREVVAPQLAEVYPQFAAQVFGAGQSALTG